MPFKVAIASGKGGTGKTTVAVNLFSIISENWTKNVHLLDCDVEEPNDLLFFRNFSTLSQKKVQQEIPEIDLNKCTFCKKCEEYCAFNAIVMMPSVNYAEVNSDLCHSCGACLVACQHGAIKENPHSIGSIAEYKTTNGSFVKEACLRVGSPMQTRMIKELKSEKFNGAEVIIYDAPPGTSCPVVETVADADYVVLVTEPTPFGMYDLQLTVDLMKDMKKNFGVVVNKAGLGNSEVYDYLGKEGIELLGEIPFDKEYATQYAKGNLLLNISHSIEKEYQKIAENLRDRSKKS